MKKIIFFLASLMLAKTIYPAEPHLMPFDTTIIKEWHEKNRKYKVEIIIKNAADKLGIIPGRNVECYFAINKIEINNGKERRILHFKDTCNSQAQQLVFFKNCSVQLKDINRDGKKELALIYEFAGDGFDARTVRYLLIDEKIYSAYLKFEFNEEKIKYFPATSLEGFISYFPAKYRGTCKNEYKRIISCAESLDSDFFLD